MKSLFDPETFDVPFDPPPAQRHSQPSVEAAEQIEPHAESLRGRVLAYLRSRGGMGASDEDMQHALAMNPSTQRPRRIELVASGLVFDSGRTTKTSTGRKATVWIAVPVKVSE